MNQELENNIDNKPETALPEEETKHSGQPLMFKSEQELQDKILEYFKEYCGIDEYGNIDNKSTFKQTPTVSSLALYLGTSRQTLINYEKREAYFDTIKKAKDIILSFTESALYRKNFNTAGVIFNLKNNWGWRDRTETTNTNFDIEIDENKEATETADFLKRFALVEKRKQERLEQSDTI